MRGSIRKHGKGWQGRVDIGPDPKTGKRRVRYVNCAKKGEVQAAIAKILTALGEGEYIDASKATLGEWLDRWFETAIEGTKRPRTCERYRLVLDKHLKPELGHIVLQQLQATDLEQYYKSSPLSGATLALHHTVIHSALASAMRKRILRWNEAALVDGQPRARGKNDTTEIRENCWDADEARQFLTAACEAGPQQWAFYSLALELGPRKNEIAALAWKHVDLERGTLQLVHQLSRRSPEPEFVPLKSGLPRTLDLSDELIALLKAHRRHQSEIKMRNRRAYHDHGLVFAKEVRVTSTQRIGDPLTVAHIAEREFDSLIKKAGVPRIKFHGLRHTSATLALEAGVSVKIVAHRLGHSKTSITLDLYGHVLPGAAKEAASKMGSILHG